MQSIFFQKESRPTHHSNPPPLPHARTLFTYLHTYLHTCRCCLCTSHPTKCRCLLFVSPSLWLLCFEAAHRLLFTAQLHCHAANPLSAFPAALRTALKMHEVVVATEARMLCIACCPGLPAVQLHCQAVTSIPICTARSTHNAQGLCVQGASPLAAACCTVCCTY
jgi:hypothetical protein